jgi:Tfp pilus assembly protein PilF
MGAHLERARLLFGQSRHELAEQELRLELAEDPQGAEAHALLALCLSELKRYEPATQEARQAIALAPDEAFGHYALAHVMFDRRRMEEALVAAREALRLEPDDPDYHALVAQVLLSERRWDETLATAEIGLQLDPEHVACNNLRAIALVKLGRRQEAGRTLEAALARDPEDAVSHANRGWTLLEGGDPNKAMEHFREALRLQPQMEWARLGIVEALKSRNFIYRWLLKYFFWMSRLSGKAQVAVLVGGWLGFQVLRNLKVKGTSWALVVSVLEWTYILFALMTWIAQPLFNLTLRVNRFGRLALSRHEITASNWVGGCLFLALGSLGTWIATRHPLALDGTVVFGMLVIPLAATFNCQEGWPRRAMAAYTAILVASVVAIEALDAVGSIRTRRLQEGLLMVYLVGTVCAPWVANIMMVMRPKR